MKHSLLVFITGCLVGTGMPASLGSAQEPEPVTWDQAAATTHFPVWRPARTFGLRAKVFQHRCDHGKVPDIVSVRWGGPRRKRFSLAQFFPRRCGDPGEARVVRTVRIGDERVAISVYCPTVACDPTGTRRVSPEGSRSVAKSPSRAMSWTPDPALRASCPPRPGRSSTLCTVVPSGISASGSALPGRMSLPGPDEIVWPTARPTGARM